MNYLVAYYYCGKYESIHYSNRTREYVDAQCAMITRYGATGIVVTQY